MAQMMPDTLFGFIFVTANFPKPLWPHPFKHEWNLKYNS